jgi:hypothetical protein
MRDQPLIGFLIYRVLGPSLTLMSKSPKDYRRVLVRDDPKATFYALRPRR